MSTISTALLPVRQSRPLLILLAGVICGNLPLLINHFHNMWLQPQYQYFPFVLGAFGWLLKSRATWRTAPVEAGRSTAAAVPAMAFAILCAIAATIVNSPWVAALSFIVAVGGVMLVLQKWVEIENPVGIWAVLCLILRPPLGLDTKLALWLQRMTAQVSGGLLDLLGTQCIVDGNTIVLAERQLFVEEACSGVVSLMAIVAACVIIAVFQNRPAPHAILLTASAVVWAGALNILRIVIIGLMLHNYQIDLTAGWRHEVLGLTLFACTTGLCLCTDQLLVFLLAPVWDESDGYDSYTEGNSSRLSRFWNLLVEPSSYFRRPPAPLTDSDQASAPLAGSKVMPAIGAVLLLIGLSQLVLIFTGRGRAMKPDPAASALAIHEGTMPETWHGMQRVGFKPEKRGANAVLGEHSRQWTYSGTTGTVLASMDFVFHDFHELTVCYEGIGWRVSDRIVRDGADGGQYVQAMLVRDTGEKATLLFGSFDPEGETVPPPDANLVAGLADRISHTQDFGVYQVQVLFQSAATTDLQQLSRVFHDFADRMKTVVTEKQP